MIVDKEGKGKRTRYSQPAEDGVRQLMADENAAIRNSLVALGLSESERKAPECGENSRCCVMENPKNISRIRDATLCLVLHGLDLSSASLT